MTTVVISQPMYFPWIGLVGQMALADVFIWLDDAQFSKGSFTNRVQVKTATGCVWMTVPLAGRGTFQEICCLAPNENRWRQYHRNILQQELKGQPYLDDAIRIYDSCVEREPLVEALIASAEQPAAYLDVRPRELVRSSKMDVGGSSTERVTALVKAVGGTRYVTGHGAANYLRHELLEKAGIQVDYLNHEIYPWHQRHGDFTPYVTILDTIASSGTDAAKHLPRTTVGWREFMAGRATQDA